MKPYLTVAIALLFSCCSSQSNIVGKYMNSKFGSIEFRPDSTYYYESGSHSLFVRSEGIWDSNDKGGVLIFSDIRSTYIPLEIEVQKMNSSLSYSEIDVSVKLKSGNLADYQCAIFVNDNLHLIKRCDSLALVKFSEPIRSIYFKILKTPQLSNTSAISPPLVTDVYRAEADLESKLKFKVYVDDSKFFYRSFDGYRIKLSRKNLYFFDLDNQRWKKLKKVSDHIDIFSSFGKTLR
ncbi:hypothetical protein [Parapedobacter sp. DT-150]|uniref:hypothetical protein n=1 Tax=Parapedobacter sp. DT-150 TaxID=3396162 RepID=UPI003F1C7AE2